MFKKHLKHMSNTYQQLVCVCACRVCVCACFLHVMYVRVDVFLYSCMCVCVCVCVFGCWFFFVATSGTQVEGGVAQCTSSCVAACRVASLGNTTSTDTMTVTSPAWKPEAKVTDMFGNQHAASEYHYSNFGAGAHGHHLAHYHLNDYHGLAHHSFKPEDSAPSFRTLQSCAAQF